MDIETTGEGDAIIFFDGIAHIGTWKKSENDRTRFYTAANEEIRLNAGKIWVEVVPTDRNVEYN